MKLKSTPIFLLVLLVSSPAFAFIARLFSLQEMLDQGRLWPGFSVAPVNDALRQQFDLNPQAGALIIGSVDEGSPADIAGLKRGDLIRSVNGQEVNSLLEFYQNFNDSKSREILFSINRQDTELIIGLVR